MEMCRMASDFPKPKRFFQVDLKNLNACDLLVGPIVLISDPSFCYLELNHLVTSHCVERVA